MKIAAQLYSLRDYCKNITEIESTFERVYDIGYRSVQLSGIDFSQPEKLAKLVEKYGFDVCLTHMPLDRMLNDMDNLIEEHKMYGCNTIGLGGLPDMYSTSKQGYVDFATIVNGITKKLKAHDMQFSYHNHAFELANLGQGQGKGKGKGLDILFENTSDDCLFTLDLYWIQAGGAFPASYLEKFKGRVKIAHFKDMGVANNAPIMAPVGDGNMDYQILTDVAVKTGVQYAAVEQDDCYGADPFECLKTSFDNITKYLAK